MDIIIAINNYLNKVFSKSTTNAEALANVKSFIQTQPFSLRTLQRRLRKDGTSWEAILDTHRKARGIVLVEDKVPNGDIAKILGYNDGKCFSRAFVRWMGLPPREYRKIQARPDVKLTDMYGRSIN